jgi:hypothetical protein
MHLALKTLVVKSKYNTPSFLNVAELAKRFFTLSPNINGETIRIENNNKLTNGAMYLS